MAGDATSLFAALVPAKSRLEASAASWISRIDPQQPISRHTQSNAGERRPSRIPAMTTPTPVARYSPHLLAKVNDRLTFPIVPTPLLRRVRVSSSGSPRATALLVLSAIENSVISSQLAGPNWNFPLPTPSVAISRLHSRKAVRWLANSYASIPVAFTSRPTLGPLPTIVPSAPGRYIWSTTVSRSRSCWTSSRSPNHTQE